MEMNRGIRIRDCVVAQSQQRRRCASSVSDGDSDDSWPFATWAFGQQEPSQIVQALDSSTVAVDEYGNRSIARSPQIENLRRKLTYQFVGELTKDANRAADVSAEVLINRRHDPRLRFSFPIRSDAVRETDLDRVELTPALPAPVEGVQKILPVLRADA
jgi:hypothetical protein